MAWLQATPRPPAGSHRAKVADQQPKISRLDRIKKDGGKPSMPPNPAPHIIGWLVEMGLVSSIGASAGPLTWLEIQAWQFDTGVPLEPWVARLLRRLSAAYLSFSRKAEDEGCPAPWHTPATKREVQVAEARLRMVLG